ncbi:uncharacterized protein [Mytilus edulis]|uniref:uncharacterized protein isoform X1 n=2 Tax=Mytilus edulis TaxID=6550 RepID=UPI0039EEBCA8
MVMIINSLNATQIIDTKYFMLISTEIHKACKFVSRMVSISLTVNTLLSVGIACLCFVTMETRPTDQDGDLSELIRSYYVDNYSDISNGLTDGNDLKNSQIKENIVPYISQVRPEVRRHRIKRLGIAGHENIDMILNHLKSSRQNRFRPALSVGGSFANLRNMMSKAGR